MIFRLEEMNIWFFFTWQFWVTYVFIYEKRMLDVFFSVLYVIDIFSFSINNILLINLEGISAGEI